MAPLLPPPPLLLVVGMHRSGTSLLTAMLQATGVELPGTLIPGDRHNPEGYFEWDELVQLQERLLIDLDRWWPSAQGCLSLPPGWLDHPASLAAHKDMIRILERVTTRIKAPCWAFKDPRTSRLLPLWLRMASELSIPLRLLLAVRDPAEVTRSLVQRDGPSTGMNTQRAQILWWQFTLEPLQAAAESLPVTTIHYGHWFSQPELQLQRLLAAMPELRPTPEQRRTALGLIRPEHRRSVGHKPDERLKLNRSVRRLHQALLGPGPTPLPPAHPPGTLRDKKPMPSQLRRIAEDPASWPAWLKHWRHYPAPRMAGKPSVASRARIRLYGMTFKQPTAHLLLQRLPISGIAASQILNNPEETAELLLATPPDTIPSNGLARITINLELPPPEQAQQWLEQLRGEQAILDPDPPRVCLMRALGLPAHWLDPDVEANGWLSQAAAISPSCWSAQLGMAPPTEGALIVLGHAGVEWDKALAKESAEPTNPRAASQPQPFSIDYRPGWFSLVNPTLHAAIAQAGWLAAAAGKAYALIWIKASEEESIALLQADASARLLLEQTPLTPTKLRAQLTPRPAQALAEDRPSPHTQTLVAWRSEEPSRAAVIVSLFKYIAQLLLEQTPLTPTEPRAQLTPRPAQALAEDRPSPHAQTLVAWRSEEPSRAAVIVSLYNYSDWVLDALNSVAQQRQRQLELIVVDDASCDDGLERVAAWMQEQIASSQHPFTRLQLVRHDHNVGLATARNTGFNLAEADWCFVLDADNILYPDAIAACLALAEAGPDGLVVVHPIIAVEADPSMVDEHRSLVATATWQQEVLAQGNVVDAMALVRRSAWKSVGGYSHIEGGWEDYDFWCKLIAHGFHGVQCPMVLATYRSHANSMSATVTNRSLPPLRRTLQERHPWLHLT
jgi:GT2 family glycosyltransferase